jgi:hypothetical protein
MSNPEPNSRERQRVYLLEEFCEVFRCTRSRAYEDMASGRLKARKAGRITIITDEDAESWLQSLPVRQPRREAAA